MLGKIKKTIRQLKSLLLLFISFCRYGLSGKMPSWTGNVHIVSFCNTSGHSNDWMSRALSIFFPAKKMEFESSVLAPLSPEQLAAVTDGLDRNGYVMLDQRLPAELCDRLMHFAVTQEAVLRQTDGQQHAHRTAVYDAANPQAVIYDFEKEAILGNAEVQALLIDPALISIAQSYFRSEPIADMLSMWWSTAYTDKPDGEAAQMYHFDMDRIKWLKVFIYLTDVGKDNGPHYFVAGSHRSGGIPQALLDKGYVRLQDEDIAHHFPPENILEFTAPRGSILIEDTRGLHKGQHIREGHRLILQFQFSNSCFGAETRKPVVDAGKDSALTRMARRYPRMFSGYNIKI